MKKAGILIITLVLPAFLIYFLGDSGERHAYLPIYGPKTVNEKGDSVYHQASLPSLDSIKTPHLKIIHFFSCFCEEECGRTFSFLNTLGERNKYSNEIGYYHYNVGTTTCLDTIIKDYKWNKRQFFIPLNDSTFHHHQEMLLLSKTSLTKKWQQKFSNELLILLDRKNRVRGLYKGSSKKQVENLFQEIQLLNNIVKDDRE